MKVPKSFNFQGHTIRVVYDNDRCAERNCVGLACYMENAIILADRADDKDLPESVKLHSYYHELLHFIFSATGQERLNSDEKFIDIAAGLLHQVLLTSKYDEDTDKKI